MKSRIKFRAIVAVIAIASFSLSSFASGDIRVSPMKESSKAIVEIQVPTQADVNVTLKDPRGYIIHSDILSKNSKYGKVFDFSRVEDGRYTLITQTGNTTVFKTLELENNTLSVVEKELSYTPIFEVDGDILKVNYLNKSTKDISISLTDATKEYFTEEGGNSISYGKMLDIGNLPRGVYNFTLSSGDKTYYYQFVR